MTTTLALITRSLIFMLHIYLYQRLMFLSQTVNVRPAVQFQIHRILFNMKPSWSQDTLYLRERVLLLIEKTYKLVWYIAVFNLLNWRLDRERAKQFIILQQNVFLFLLLELIQAYIRQWEYIGFCCLLNLK